MQILTNPANAEKLMESLRRSDRAAMDGGKMLATLEGVRIVTDPSIPELTSTGRYVLPGGRAVPPEKVRVLEGRFIEYGPEDIPFLLRRGIIQRQMEPTFYWVNLDSLAMFGSMTGGF